MAKYKLEYIWLDGYTPVPNLRGKTQLKDYDAFPTLEQLPLWGFDGSSTMQAEGHSSDCVLKPVAVYPDATRINGVLVNWYDGELEHRISQHKDSPIGRIAGCPIVTVSFGASRGFQMVVRKQRVTFEVGDGDVIVIPDETNRRFAHAVPHREGDTGRRVSVTLRGFEDA